MRLAGLRGLAAIPRRVRTTDRCHDYPIAPKRLRRNFTATAPNQVWLADLTYIRTGEGWLFLAALIDMHTRKVVGWSMRETLHASIALEALDMAIRRQRPAPGFAIDLERMATRWLTPAFRARLQITGGYGAQGGLTPSTFSGQDHRQYAPQRQTRRR